MALARDVFRKPVAEDRGLQESGKWSNVYFVNSITPIPPLSHSLSLSHMLAPTPSPPLPATRLLH